MTLYSALHVSAHQSCHLALSVCVMPMGTLHMSGLNWLRLCSLSRLQREGRN